jgi:hypothetical protein
VKGRTDVKDGLIIYNNDIFTDMVAYDYARTDEPCTVTAEGGDGSAEQQALTDGALKLQERFADLYFERVKLASNEKIRYWNGVQRDIANNRYQGANSGWSGLFFRARSLGFIGTILGAFANASRFYWHTNSQNIEHLSRVTFSQLTIIDQNKEIEYPLGTANMCIVWNTQIKRFLACSDEEQRVAQTPRDASDEARNSYLCDDNDTAIECGEARNEDADTDENGNIEAEQPTPPPPETEFPDEI